MKVILEELRELIGEVLKNKKLGTLTLGRGEHQRHIFLDKDHCYLLSNEVMPCIAVPERLRKSFGISADAFLETLEYAHRSKTTVCEVLRSKNYISAEAYGQLLKIQIREEMLDAIFKCRNSFIFHEAYIPNELLQHEGYAARIGLSHEELNKAIQSREKAFCEISRLIPSQEEVFVTTEKGLSTRKASQNICFTSVYDLIDGLRTVSDIIRDSPFYESSVLTQLYTSLKNGLIKKTRLPELEGVDPGSLTPGQGDDYIPLFEQGAKYATDEFKARGNLAAAYTATGKFHQASLQYEQLGDSFYKAGKVDKALQNHSAAVRLEPAESRVRDKIAAICIKEAKNRTEAGDRDSGIHLLQQACEFNPGKTGIYSLLASQLQKKRDSKALSKLLDQATEHAHKNKDWKPATTLAKKLEEYSLSDHHIKHKIANLLIEAGATDEAIRHMEEIAAAHLERGEEEKALRVFTKIRQLSPQRRDIQQRVKRTQRRVKKRARTRIPLRAAILFLVFVLLAYQVLGLVAFNRIPHAESASKTVRACKKFERHYPLSLCRLLARRRAEQALGNQEAAKAADRKKARKLLKEANHAEELGYMKEARKLYGRVAGKQLPDLAHQAKVSLKRLDSRKREAAELLSKAKKRNKAGAYEEAFSLMKQLVAEYPGTEAAFEATFPTRIKSTPPGARVRIGGKASGSTPLTIQLKGFETKKVKLLLTGYQPYTEELSGGEKPAITIELSVSPEWSNTFPYTITPSLLALGDRIYTAAGDGTLRSVSKKSGEETRKWEIVGATDITAGPVAVGSTVVFATNNGCICSVDKTKELSTRQAGRLIKTGLVPSPNQSVCFGTSEGKVRRQSLRTGEVIWETQTPSPLRPQTASAGQAAVFLGQDSLIRAFSKEDGAMLWKLQCPANAELYAGTGCVLAANSKTIICAEATGGRVLWEKKLSKPATSLLVHGTCVWAGCRDGEIIKLNLKTGKRNSSLTAEGAVEKWLHLPSAVLAALPNGELYTFDPETLKKRCLFRAKAPISALEQSGGRIYVLSSHSRIDCIAP